MTRTGRIRWDLLLVFVLMLLAAESSMAQSRPHAVEGLWSDPPATPEGELCSGWCTDAGLAQLNKLLDDPANDTRPFVELQAEAARFQRDTYIRPKLTDTALQYYPLDPADDPSFLRCEPYGFARQIVSRHQIEIRQSSRDTVAIRYGEWDARRIVYLDGRARRSDEPATRLGHSVGRWEGEMLVIETTGITANMIFGNAGTKHSDQLRVIERLSRSADGKTLLLSATFTDPVSFKEPVVLKRMWSWAPQSRITPYEDCERPQEFQKSGGR